MRYEEKFTLLTFYHFVDVKDPESTCLEHLIFTKDIGMKGRIYIGTEWISSTVTWNQWQIQAYKLYLANHPLWKDIADIDVKSSPTDSHKFPRMQVKVRDEIVTLGKKYSKEEIEEAGNRITIEEFKDLLENKNPDDYVILDMRNNHEYKLWHFKNAIPANTLNFRDLDAQIEDYKKEFWDKMVISYCTGWIRCEKSTVMLQKAWLKNTYQLDGWVVKYINTYNDRNWLGNLYVFDERVSQQVWDEKTHTTIGECLYSWKKTDNCENCRYSPCNARMIADKEEYVSHKGFCSKECADKAANDLLIKTDLEIDSMNYKQKRGVIKAKPELKEEIESEMRKHIQKQLQDIDFNHETSQKEDFIID